jgi:hypothetical protein
MNFDELKADFDGKIAGLLWTLEQMNEQNPSREISLAKTKIEEAQLWLGKAAAK